MLLQAPLDLRLKTIEATGGPQARVEKTMVDGLDLDTHLAEVGVSFGLAKTGHTSNHRSSPSIEVPPSQPVV
jgi:hypothetical protein